MKKVFIGFVQLKYFFIRMLIHIFSIITDKSYRLKYFGNKAVPNNLKRAKHCGEKLLEYAESVSSDWNYGNMVHQGNLILGRVALKEGDVSEGKSFLLKAGATSGSPQLNSFGPNMLLAKELLEKVNRKLF